MATAAKKKTEQEDLGTLNIGSSQIYATPLPSPTKSFIVRYDQSIGIACVIPSKKYVIRIRGDGTRRADPRDSAKKAFKQMKEKTIHAPSLILLTEYYEAPTYNNVSRVLAQHHLYAYHTRYRDKSVILGAPYLLSNVHSGGSICFGSMRPVSPREAFATFWNSPFNAELLGEHLVEHYGKDYDSVSDYIDEYHDTVYRNQPWEDITETVCGKKTWACPKGGDAVLVTSERSLLQQIPRKYWRKFKDSAIIIARGKKGKKSWSFESGGFKFKLPLCSVTFSNFAKDDLQRRQREWQQRVRSNPQRGAGLPYGRYVTPSRW